MTLDERNKREYYLLLAKSWLEENIGPGPQAFYGSSKEKRTPFAHEVFSLANLLESVVPEGELRDAHVDHQVQYLLSKNR